MNAGTSLTDAIRAWPTPRAEDGESAGNHPSSQDSLTGVAKFWRTPDAPNSGGVRNRQGSRGAGHQLTIAEQAEHWPTPNVPNGGRTTSTSNYSATGEKRQVELGAVASRWPTPKLSDTNGERMEDGKRNTGLNTHAAHWPTPAARDYKGENSSEHLEVATGRKHLDQLPNFVRHSFRPDPTIMSRGVSSSPSARILRQPSLFEMTDSPSPVSTPPSPDTPKTKLNPRFVEWLMGLPTGWTGFALAGTEWSRWRQQSRSALSGIGC